MADTPTEPKPAAQVPPAEGGEAAPAAPSKKGAKKAEAKAKKEAEKARKAAEREAAAAAAKAASAANDPAKANYGDITPTTKVDAERTYLRDLGEEHIDKVIKLRAWVQNTRPQSASIGFVELREERDWSIQGVMLANSEGTVSKQMVKWLGSLPLESFVLVEAKVVKPVEPVKSCKVSDYELQISRCYLIAPAPPVLGLGFAVANRAVASFEDEEQANDAEKVAEAGVAGLSLDALPNASLTTHLNNPAMHKRAPIQQAIADVRIAVRKLFSEYLDSKRFNQFEPPALIAASSEGGANVFSMPYFDKSAYLAQSPQFYKQMEIAGGRKRVYCIAPVFRAENSNTPRHMTEFTGLDLEMEIEEHYHEVRDTLEAVLLYIFRGLKERCAEQIELVRTAYPSEDFLLPEPGKEVRLTFAEGQKLLREEGPEEFRNVSDDEDMSTPQEKALGALIKEKFKTDFYVLDKFPEGARPFYAREDPENRKLTNSYDFFMRGQEILSGGQRIHLPDELEARLRTKGIDPQSPGIKEYVDVFRSAGVPPHGGGGIGLDRVVAWYLNLPSVHLTSYYPRTPKRLLP
ncbi:related to aspartate--tRNA ligase [Cephalotrichum gorgonifer]|uniref:Probable aspartate--tRNA ligase, cytoplasmic n=1 Tax=Cephalotrichum gorgonifer TaxID=2041049 RepID=A0AAE8MV38_9PEZI|nr:related to aspartate--tRNA ligase [Cephalotrichum gorgonifer]